MRTHEADLVNNDKSIKAHDSADADGPCLSAKGNAPILICVTGLPGNMSTVGDSKLIVDGKGKVSSAVLKILLDLNLHKATVDTVSPDNSFVTY